MKFLEMEKAIDYLREHGRTIAAQAIEGDKLCNDIMTWYGLHYKAPGDPGAQAIVMVLLDRYAERRCSK